MTADRRSSRGRKTGVSSFTHMPRFARSSARWASACEPGYHFRRFALSSRCTTTRRVILVADQPRVVVRSALWRRTDMALPHSKLWQETVHILHLVQSFDFSRRVQTCRNSRIAISWFFSSTIPSPNCNPQHPHPSPTSLLLVLILTAELL